MIFALDTNVLLDVLYEDGAFHDRSKTVLEEASSEGVFVICPEVYAELVAAFAERVERPREEVDRFLESVGIVRDTHAAEAVATAGKAWKEYSATAAVECPSCGADNEFACTDCGGGVQWRNHLITDFMIGAHAAVEADRLVTRDEGYFDTYFDADIWYPESQ